MIQSAEEFACAVRGVKEYPPHKTGEYVMQQKDYAPISQGAAIDLISARDKAIIERCKEKFKEDADEDYVGHGPSWHMETIFVFLDSVLREIE